MTAHILPDTRTKVVRGSIPSKLGNLIPVHCANCGKPHGMVNEHDITFAFALCDPCAEVYGHDAHFYVEPDAVHFERCAEAMREMGVSTPEELARTMSEGSNPIATLANEWHAKLRKHT